MRDLSQYGFHATCSRAASSSAVDCGHQDGPTLTPNGLRFDKETGWRLFIANDGLRFWRDMIPGESNGSHFTWDHTIVASYTQTQAWNAVIFWDNNHNESKVKIEYFESTITEASEDWDNTDVSWETSTVDGWYYHVLRVTWNRVLLPYNTLRQRNFVWLSSQNLGWSYAYQQREYQYYINSSQFTRWVTNCSQTHCWPDNHFRIWSWQGNDEWVLDGTIHEVRVYNRVLSPQEIRTLQQVMNQ